MPSKQSDTQRRILWPARLLGGAAVGLTGLGILGFLVGIVVIVNMVNSGWGELKTRPLAIGLRCAAVFAPAVGLVSVSIVIYGFSMRRWKPVKYACAGVVLAWVVLLGDMLWLAPPRVDPPRNGESFEQIVDRFGDPHPAPGGGAMDEQGWAVFTFKNGGGAYSVRFVDGIAVDVRVYYRG